MKPFDYLNAINFTKENLDIDEKSYSPWVINRGLSYFEDTVFHSNMMNRLHMLDKKAQFLFLLNSIRPRKRFSKWFKSELEENIEVISEFYGYSHDKARQVLHLFSLDQLNIMKKQLEKGGLKQKEKKNAN
jgi:hypothetical protein